MFYCCTRWQKPEKILLAFRGHEWTCVAMWQGRVSAATLILGCKKVTEMQRDTQTQIWRGSLDDGAWLARSVCHGKRRRSTVDIRVCCLDMRGPEHSLPAGPSKESIERQRCGRCGERETERETESERGRRKDGREEKGDSLRDVELDVLARRGWIFRPITAHLCPYIKCFPQVGMWVEREMPLMCVVKCGERKAMWTIKKAVHPKGPAMTVRYHASSLPSSSALFGPFQSVFRAPAVNCTTNNCLMSIQSPPHDQHIWCVLCLCNVLVLHHLTWSITSFTWVNYSIFVCMNTWVAKVVPLMLNMWPPPTHGCDWDQVLEQRNGS